MTNENVFSLRPPTELAGFLRLGRTGFRRLADLHAGGRLPFRRLVVDAAYFVEQLDFIRDLQIDGCEIVLDPNFAELATPGRHNASSLQKLPWALPGRPWTVDEFARPTNFDVTKAIAEFAVAADVSAVLAPTHLWEPEDSSWRSIDLRLCEALRHELDRAGGADIAVDFQWITTANGLKDAAARKQLAVDLVSLPVENLWVRAAGFGASATGAATRSYVRSVGALHETGKPIVSDMTGGLAGLATLALGASAAISHGIGMRENFNLSSWKSARKASGPVTTRIYVAELDRYFTEKQLREVFSLRGGKSRLCCVDRTCCPQGPDDMIENHDAHFLMRRHQQIADLSAVPDSRRGDHFLSQLVEPAVQTARLLDRLEKSDPKLGEAILKAKGRLVRLRDAIAHQLVEAPLTTHSRAPRFRGGNGKVGAVLRQ
ncbi:hypothetical protein [Tardiphaga sp.]|jgi:hypothetical protein|uniref:hypothetical protein n=1 Tax=Tardiphaga sp. TaxID=1926292 RepID=UPI00352AEE8B